MNRKYLKQQAKDVLKKHYWKIFLLILVTAVLCFKFIGFSTETFYAYDYSSSYTIYYLTILGFKIALEPSPILLVIITISGLASIIYSLLFSTVLQYGKLNKLKYYALGRENEFSLFDGFKNNYINIIITNFMAGLITVLWTFLFIIPGIIKAIQYQYVNEVLEEHPDWGWKQVLKESKRLTQGYKWQLFVLDLSFILWYILTAFTFGIGEYFLNPYVELTRSFAYLFLKQQKDVINVEPELIMNENMF